MKNQIDKTWFKNRIKEAGGQQVVADAIGRDRTIVSKIINGHQKKLDRDVVAGLAKALNSSIAEVLERLGLADEARYVEGEIIESPHAAEVVEVAGEDYAAIPRWDMRASAGYGQIAPASPETLHRILFRMAWLQTATRATLDKVFALDVFGDSMDPTLRHGDVALVDMTRTKPSGGDIFLLSWDGELFVKRVQVDFRSKLLIVKSDNPAYEDLHEVNPDDLDIIGRVFWIGRAF